MSPASPQLQPLSQNNRRFVFLSMALLFVCLVPLLVFYATGYRLNLFDVDGTLRVVGGFYVATSVTDANIVLNGEPASSMRIFQRAAYIQNVPAGVHEIFVEAPEVTTWVKELPVFAHLVTEARSFNMPVVPQVRVITPWLHVASGASALFETPSTTPFATASTSNTFYVATTTTPATSLVANTEHAYVLSLFATTTATTTDTEVSPIERFSFDRVATTINDETSLVTEVATTTRVLQNTRLFEDDGEVYVLWLGEQRTIPYYYCVNYQGASSTTMLYGEHVYAQLEAELASTTDLVSETHHNQLLCRNTIRIDRGFSDVHWFDFMPDNPDLILLLLDDGLYVVEADDRAWQNRQVLYPGHDLEVAIDGRSIYVRDGDYLLSVSTELHG